VPAWRIIVHQRVLGGRFELRDEFLVRRSDLRPISLKSRRGTRSAGAGWHEIEIEYGERAITGTRSRPEGVTAINVPLTGPVWDGNLWGVTFAALRLKAGAQYHLPLWQYDKGFGTFTINVTGTQSVDTPSGKADAWILEAGDNPAQLVRYFVGKRTRAELGYEGPGLRQMIGGDCRGMG
jgi:hypothetical protein